AGARIDDALQRVGSARKTITQSLFVSVVRVVPGLATQRAGLLALVDDSRVGATAGRRLLDQADALASRTRVVSGAVPLDAIFDLESVVRRAGEEISPLARSPSGLWGPLRDARKRFDEIATSGSNRLLRGADALGAARAFLGGDGER